MAVQKDGARSQLGQADRESPGQSSYRSFSPREYIREYYSVLSRENRFLLDFYHDVYRRVPESARVLEFGGGPTIYQLLSASLTVKEIIFAEFLDCNRREVARWLRRDKHAADWNSFVEYVSERVISEGTLLRPGQIENAVRSKVTHIVECDALLEEVLPAFVTQRFDVVSSGFCLECISGEEWVFLKALRDLSCFVSCGGKLLITALKGATSYRVDNLVFPAFPLTESYLEKQLSGLGFSVDEMRVCPAEYDQGYEGLIAVSAYRSVETRER